MKVNNNKDSVELSHLGRKKADKTGAANKKSADAVAAPLTPSTGEAAGVEISGEAKALAAANQIAKSPDEINQAKVDRVKAMMNAGTYKPDFGKVADKMINEAVLDNS